MLTHIDLFSGIGGFALAAQWAGFKTVAFCEIEPYCQEILKERFGAVANANARDVECGQGERPAICCPENYEGTNDYIGGRSARFFSDIRSFPASDYRGATLLTGGFPCQPFSQAGKRRGKEDDRYLWPEMLRVISEARPRWVLGENVAGIVTMELDRVLSDLEGEGYSCQPLIIPACAVDAKHRRDRVWIVGYAASARCNDSRKHGGGSSSLSPRSEQPSQDVADAECGERERRSAWIGRRNGTSADVECPSRRGSSERNVRWLPEPDVGRVAHGIPRRVDRLKGLGNAIVPQLAYEIIAGIAEIEMERAKEMARRKEWTNESKQR